MTWLIAFKGRSGFSASNTAEDVTKGIDGHGLTAIVTGFFFYLKYYFQYLKFVGLLGNFASII